MGNSLCEAKQMAVMRCMYIVLCAGIDFAAAICTIMRRGDNGKQFIEAQINELMRHGHLE